MRLSRAVAEYIQDLRARGQSKATVDAYSSDLNRLVAMAGHDTVLNVTPDLITRHFRDLSESSFAMSTLHRKTAVLREFIRWGRRQRLWADSDALIEAVPRIRRPVPLPRPFSRDEADRIWKLELPMEQRVLRAVLFFTGLRATAICSILVGNVSEHPPAIATITKGGRTVLKPMHPKLAELVCGYILARTDLRPQSFLFTTKTGRPMTKRHLEEITKGWGAAAGVMGCLPHRFRHTMATEMLRGKTDIRVIQEALDHRDLKSTAIYTRVHNAQVVAAFQNLPWGQA